MAPASSPRRSIHGRSRVAVYTNSPYVRVAAIVVGTIGVLLLCMSYKVYTSDGLRATSVNLAEGNLRVPDRAIVDVKSKESNDNGKGGADFGPPVTFRTCVNSNHIALTFDDGPSVWTLALLDIFERYGVKATFFFVGVNLEHDPTNRRAAQLVFEKGHQVASHTWSHKRLTDLTAANIREELRRTSDIIKTVTGHRPRYMRPPYGSTSNAVDTTIFAEGYKSMMWSCDSNDWRYTREADVTPNIENCNLNGLVLLLHEGRASTAEAVEKFIIRVRAEHPEKKFVRADECSGYPGDADVAEVRRLGSSRQV